MYAPGESATELGGLTGGPRPPRPDMHVPEELVLYWNRRLLEGRSRDWT